MAGIQELGGSYRILGRLTCSPWRCEFAEGLGDLCQRIIGHHERVGQPHRIVVEHVRAPPTREQLHGEDLLQCVLEPHQCHPTPLTLLIAVPWKALSPV